MKFRWLALGLLLISNIQPITVEAQSEQMRYAQQRNHWRSQEIHNDVQKRMEEARKRMEESRSRMGVGNSRGSSYGSSYGSGSSHSSSYGSNYGSSSSSHSQYHPSTGSSYSHTSATAHPSGQSASEHALLGDPNFTPPKIAEISTYPGRPSYSYTTNSPKVGFGTMTGFRFKTTDSPTQVFTFYSKDLQAHGWKFDTKSCRSDHLAAEHPKVNRRVTITYKAAEGGGTDVDLDYSQNLNLKMGNDPITNFAKSTNFSNMGNNERVKTNNSAFPGMILPGTNLDNNERIQRGLK